MVSNSATAGAQAVHTRKSVNTPLRNTTPINKVPPSPARHNAELILQQRQQEQQSIVAWSQMGQRWRRGVVGKMRWEIGGKSTHKDNARHCCYRAPRELICFVEAPHSSLCNLKLAR